MEQLAHRVHKVQLEHKVLQAQLGQLEQQAHKVLKELLVQQAHKVLQVQWEQLERKEQLVHKVHKEQLGLQVL